MAKMIETRIENLIPDDKNFNKGTQFGEHLMDESLRKFGLGRSILIDKNNRIIAGNKTAEKAADIGFDNVIIVETDGNSLVAVKRKDIDLDSAKGRELALADNATAKNSTLTRKIGACPLILIQKKKTMMKIPEKRLLTHV